MCGATIARELAKGSFYPPADCIPASAFRMRGMEFFLKFVGLPAIVAVIFWPLVISIINARNPLP